MLSQDDQKAAHGGRTFPDIRFHKYLNFQATWIILRLY